MPEKLFIKQIGKEIILHLGFWTNHGKVTACVHLLTRNNISTFKTSLTKLFAKNSNN